MIVNLAGFWVVCIERKIRSDHCPETFQDFEVSLRVSPDSVKNVVIGEKMDNLVLRMRFPHGKIKSDEFASAQWDIHSRQGRDLEVTDSSEGPFFLIMVSIPQIGVLHSDFLPIQRKGLSALLI